MKNHYLEKLQESICGYFLLISYITILLFSAKFYQ